MYRDRKTIIKPSFRSYDNVQKRPKKKNCGLACKKSAMRKRRSSAVASQSEIGNGDAQDDDNDEGNGEYEFKTLFDKRIH